MLAIRSRLFSANNKKCEPGLTQTQQVLGNFIKRKSYRIPLPTYTYKKNKISKPPFMEGHKILYKKKKWVGLSTTCKILKKLGKWKDIF